MGKTEQNKATTRLGRFEWHMHVWVVPLMHMVLWGMALIASYKAEDWFQNEEWFQRLADYMDAIQFGMVFVVFLLEILIVLSDFYISYRTDNFKPSFVISSIIFVFFVLLTGFAAVCAILGKVINNDMGIWLCIIIITSSILKLAENLLINNIECLIVPSPPSYDIGGNPYECRGIE